MGFEKLVILGIDIQTGPSCGCATINILPSAPIFLQSWMEMAEQSAIIVYPGGGAVAEVKDRPYSFKDEMKRVVKGVIVEVTSVEQAKMAVEAGASCLLLSEPIHEGVMRMPDPLLFKEVNEVVSVPIIVKVRVGHFVEAQILQSVGVRYIDESDVLSVADDKNFINKKNFTSSFVCGCRGLGEALRRVNEGAAMVRTQGDVASRSGDILETLRNVRSIMGDVRELHNMDDDEVFAYSEKIAAPYDLVKKTKEIGRIPAIHFAAGGIATPADAALMLQLGCDGIFVGSEIFDYSNPIQRIKGIIMAVAHHSDPVTVAAASFGLNVAVMEPQSECERPQEELAQTADQ